LVDLLQPGHRGVVDGPSESALTELLDELGGARRLALRWVAREQRGQVVRGADRDGLGGAHVLFGEELGDDEGRRLVVEPERDLFRNEIVGGLARVAQKVADRVVVLGAGEAPHRRVAQLDAAAVERLGGGGRGKRPRRVAQVALASGERQSAYP